MDEIRNSLFRTKKKIKDRLKGSGRKPDGTRISDAGGEGASSMSSLPRPDPHVTVDGSHDREGRGVDIEGREYAQMNLHPKFEVTVKGRPGQERDDVDGKITDRIDPPPSKPSIPHSDSTWRGLIQLPPLIIPLDNPDDSAVSDQVQEVLSPNQSEPNAADENKSNWKSTASATAKLLLHAVRESADAFPPLKAVAGGLFFILENCEVRPHFPTHCSQSLQTPQQTKANEQAIDSLAHRANALSASLCTPVFGGDMKEESRRKGLER